MLDEIKNLNLIILRSYIYLTHEHSHRILIIKEQYLFDLN